MRCHYFVQKALTCAFIVGITGIFLITPVPGRQEGFVLDKRSHVIVLTERGFEPEVTTILNGDTVTFISKTGNYFWPASDLHPFHFIYPEFDPRRPIYPEESWSFTFNQSGHWSYHDHIGLATGAIIVIPPGKDVKSLRILNVECGGEASSEDKSCYHNRILNVFKEDGLEAAFEELSRVHESYPVFRGGCHLFAHDLGLISFHRYGEDVPLTEKTSYCGFGFYHGFMEGFLVRSNGNIQSAVNFCDNAGASLKGKRGLVREQCIHGIGHGIMEYLLSTRFDLAHDIESLIRMGTDQCVSMDNDDSKFRCASGVYAVAKDWIHIQDLNERHTHLFTLADPFALCKRVSSDWNKRACAWEFAKQTLRLAQYDSEKTFSAQILSASSWNEGVYLPFILVSTAFLIGELNPERDNHVLASHCASIGDDALRAHCTEGIARGLFFNASPENEITRPASFCNWYEHSSAARHACGNALVNVAVATFGEEVKNAVCQALSDQNGIPKCL